MSIREFSIRLRKLRVARAISQKEMADLLGIPATTYREWELGRSIRGFPYVRMARALDVPISELMTGERASAQDLIEAVREIESKVISLKGMLNSLF